MAYNTLLADQIRNYLKVFPDLLVEEKKMFGGLAFMVNEKMCINVSGDRLMCRFDPKQYEELSQRKGFDPMIMRGRRFSGYGYISPEGYATKSDFEFWVNLCVDFNGKAKKSKK